MANPEVPNTPTADAVERFLRRQRSPTPTADSAEKFLRSIVSENELLKLADEIVELTEKYPLVPLSKVKIEKTFKHMSVYTTLGSGPFCLGHRYQSLRYDDEWGLGVKSPNVLQVMTHTDKETQANMQSMVIADPDSYGKFFTRYYFDQLKAGTTQIIKVISLPKWWKDSRPEVKELQTSCIDPWYDSYVKRWRCGKGSEIKFVIAEMTPEDFTLIQDSLTQLKNRLQNDIV